MRPLSFLCRLPATPRKPTRLLWPGAGPLQAPQPTERDPIRPREGVRDPVTSTLIRHWDRGEHPPHSSRRPGLFSSSADPRSQALGSSVPSHPKNAARREAGRKWASRPSAASATSSQSARALVYSGASLWIALSGGGAGHQPLPRLEVGGAPQPYQDLHQGPPPPCKTVLPPTGCLSLVLTFAARSAHSPESSGDARTGRRGRTGPPRLREGRGWVTAKVPGTLGLQCGAPARPAPDLRGRRCRPPRAWRGTAESTRCSSLCGGDRRREGVSQGPHTLPAPGSLTP